MSGSMFGGVCLLALLLALAGLGGLGLAVRLSARRLAAGDRLVVFLLCGPLLLAILALALAHAGLFSLPRLLAGALLAGVCGGWGMWRAGRRPDAAALDGMRYGKTFWAGSAALLVLAGVLATPVSRYLGAWDTGVYVGTAMEVARTGRLAVQDRLLAELSDEERPAFMHAGDPSRPAWHAGFLITDAAAGRLMPEFYHLYPAWLAVWAALFGLAGVWWGQTTMALLALAMVLTAGAALLGRKAALLAGLGLTLCAAQAYAMRITSAEMMTQYALFGGFWALARSLRGGRGATGLMAVAGLAWGAALLAHGTALLPVGAALTFLLAHALAARREGERWGRLGVAALAAGLAILWNSARADAMTRFLAGLILAHPGWWAGAAALGGVLVAASLWRRGGAGAVPRFPAWLEQGGLTLLVALLLLFGYVGRPLLFSGREAANVRFFALLAGGLGLPLALGGVGARRIRDAPAAQQAFVFVSLATSMVLLVNKMAKPFYFWGARRWVEWMLPALFLLAAAALVRLAAWGGGGRPGRRRLGRTLAVLLAAVWLGLLAPPAARVYGAAEHAGLPEWFAQTAAAVRGADRVMVDHWDTAAVLRYVHGLPAWGLARMSAGAGVADAGRVAARMRQWTAAGERVYWIGGWFADPVLRLEPVGTWELETALLEQRADRLPKRTVPERRRHTVYRVSIDGPEALPETVEFGYSAMGLESGFTGLRQARDGEGRRFGYRRTRGRGCWWAPRLPGRWTLRLVQENPRRTAVPVALHVDGVLVASWDVGPAWADYGFEMPPGSNRMARLELRSPTYRTGGVRVGVGVAGMDKGSD